MSKLPTVLFMTIMKGILITGDYLEHPSELQCRLRSPSCKTFKHTRLAEVRIHLRLLRN